MGGGGVLPVTFLFRKAKEAFVKRRITGLFGSFFELLKFGGKKVQSKVLLRSQHWKMPN